MPSLPELREYKLLDFAIFDLVLAFVGMAILAPLLSYLFKKIGIKIPYRSWLMWTLPISVITHLAVGNHTPMTANFIDLSGHYFLKIVIIALLALGFIGIKKINNKKSSGENSRQPQ
ncbi:hypothetical protein ACFL2D_02910 [Patescibacteria group bacterium]